MATLSLKSRLHRYVGLPLATGVESHNPTPIDLEYHPNPTILDELIEDSKPEDDYASYDKLISEGIESLRRLDIVKASIDYPVSGYRVNMSTLLKADPAIESMVREPTFSKRQLSCAIESNKVDIIVAVLGLIVTLFGKRLAHIFINLRRKAYDKIHKVTPGEYAKLTRAMHSSKSLKWGVWKDSVAKNCPIYFKKIEASEKIIVKEYAEALFNEFVNGNTHVIVDNMINNKSDTVKLVELTNEIAVPMGMFLTDIQNSVDKLNSGYAVGQVDVKAISGKLIDDNEDFIKEVRDYEELSKHVFGSRTVNGNKLDMFKYLEGAQYIIEIGSKIHIKSIMAHEKQTRHIVGKLDSIQKILSKMKDINNPDLINDVQQVVIILRRATDTIVTLMTIIDSQSKSIAALEKSISDVQSVMPAAFN